MATVVSVTPLRVEADSRTYKQATSVGRFGHRSIVVEGQPSLGLPAVPFELRTVADTPPGRRRPGTAAAVSAGTDGSGTAGAEQVTPSPKGDGRGRVRAVLSRNARWVLRRAPWLPRALALPLWAWWYVGVQRATFRELPPADLYILHSPFGFPAVSYAARRHGAPFVYDAHDLYYVLWRDGRRFSAQHRAILRFYDLVERACVRAALARLTVSRGVAEVAQQRFGRDFIVVRNAHDLRLDADPPQRLREQLSLARDDLLLVVVGNVKPRGMALGEALEALTLLPGHVHLAFVGSGYDTWKLTAQRAGVDGRAHFMAPVPPTDVAKYVEGADLAPILYVPITVQFRNALPNGFFHAVAAGLPVLYSPDLTEVARIAERRGLGRSFDPTDPHSLARAVRELDADRATLGSLRERSLAARDQLSWEQEETVLAAVVTAALER